MNCSLKSYEHIKNDHIELGKCPQEKKKQKKNRGLHALKASLREKISYRVLALLSHTFSVACDQGVLYVKKTP